MKSIIKSVIVMSALLIGGSVFAQSLTVATGPTKKGYSNLFANINAVCGKTVPLEELNTGGGLDNLGEMATKKAELGIVQVDVFQGMEKTDDAIGRLKGLMSLNYNLLHIVVNANGFQVKTGAMICDGREILGACTGERKPVYSQVVVKSEMDLKGLTVGAVGSAQLVVRKLLNDRLKLNVQVKDIEKDVDAFNMLKAGTIHAVLTVAAAPHGLLKDFKQTDGLSLAAWTSAPGSSYKIIKKNYKNLGVFGVPFLAAPNLMMTRPVDPNSEVGMKITALRQCMQKNIGALKEGKTYEASWEDVSALTPPDDISAWSGVAVGSKKK